MGGKGFSYEQIVKDVKIASDDQEEKLDITEFENVSSKIMEVNKGTGEMIGEHFVTSVHSMKKADLEAKRRALREENERLAGIVSSLICQGNYNAVADLLKDKLQMTGGCSSESVEIFEDQIADLKAELRGADCLAEQYADELEAAENRIDGAFHQIQALQAKLAEHRFYKQKVEFLEREHEMMARSSKRMVDDDETEPISFDMDSLLANVPASAVEIVRQKLGPMAKALAKKDAMLKRMKSESRVGLDDILDALQATGDKAAAVKKMFEVQKRCQTELSEAKAAGEKMKRAVRMMQQREKHMKEMKENWAHQQKQMEQAVLLCSHIQKRDRTKFTDELKQKDEQIMKLKAAIKLKQKIIASQKTKQVMPMAAGVDRFAKPKRRTPKRARPARAGEGEVANSA